MDEVNVLKFTSTSVPTHDPDQSTWLSIVKLSKPDSDRYDCLIELHNCPPLIKENINKEETLKDILTEFGFYNPKDIKFDTLIPDTHP
jgi:hypothetical protein